MNNKFACLFISFFALWATVVNAGEGCFVKPPGDLLTGFTDDLAGKGLKDALAASIRYYSSQPEKKFYSICGRSLSSREMADSLIEFQSLYEGTSDSRALRRALQERFEFCLAAGGADRDGRILVTGYFEPVVEGSLERVSPYLYPLFKKPLDLITNESGTGRRENGRIVPYWSRAEIESQGLLRGNELVYLKDRIENFILHIQGSGRVRLPDGQLLSVQFAAKNGLPYRSIGKLLVDQGVMDLAQVSMPAIIDYLKDHPDEIDAILHHNESFVFFRLGDNKSKGPRGSLGSTLVPGRSVALDNQCFPPGALAFLEARKPVFDKENRIAGWSPMKRFVFNHDTGSAIKGSGRLDLFTGRGTRARATAGNLKSPGRLYFLVKKK